MMKSALVLKSVLMMLLMPGSVVVLIPSLILHQQGITDFPEFSVASVVATMTGLIGLTILLHCIKAFALYGKGTLAPIDPPKRLVVRGLYRYNRNPMYVGVLSILLSESLFFETASLLIYAAVAFLIFNLFVTLYEEPHLRSLFGASYEKYCAEVPRWGIAKRAFASPPP
jgi:protein-S-isoprenylcysteine O-methyltransferase Ste14